MFALGAICLARTFNAFRFSGSSSQKTYLSNGSFTVSASNGDPRMNFEEPRILPYPAPAYNSMYVRLDHLAFIPEENRVEYSDTRRCFSSVQAPTSGETKPSSCAKTPSSLVIVSPYIRCLFAYANA